MMTMMMTTTMTMIMMSMLMCQIVKCIRQCQRRLDRFSLMGHRVSVVRPTPGDVEHAMVTSDIFYCSIIVMC